MECSARLYLEIVLNSHVFSVACVLRFISLHGRTLMYVCMYVARRHDAVPLGPRYTR